MISQERKYQLGLNHAFRYFPLLMREYREDVKQEIYVTIFSVAHKHETINDYRKRVGRQLYNMSKAYGLKRQYMPGNKKSAMQMMELPILDM